MEHASLLSIVIATRDRGDRIVTGLCSILGNNYPSFEVIVVDQSRGDDTERSLDQFALDGRVLYRRSDSVGVSAARNIGIGLARGPFVVVTDDDCEASSNWLEEFAAAFVLDERIGVIAGNVVAAEHDRTVGFIPAYVRQKPFLARGIRDKHRVGGISACMGIRRSVWQSLGGFDEMLGAGAPLKSGAEGDFVIRALMAGYWVYETPRVVIHHHGFRTWEEGRGVIERYWFGTGATMIKNLRCGCWSMIPQLARQAGQWAFGRSPVAASLGTRRHRLLRLRSFLQGCAAGATAPIDRSTGHFAATAALPAPKPTGKSIMS